MDRILLQQKKGGGKYRTINAISKKTYLFKIPLEKIFSISDISFIPVSNLEKLMNEYVHDCTFVQLYMQFLVRLQQYNMDLRMTKVSKQRQKRQYLPQC